MTVKMLRQLIIVAAMISMVACSKMNPANPTPTPTCDDPFANNKGELLPCTYTPPVQSYVKLITAGINPPNGGSYSYGYSTIVPVEYGISQADRDKATQAGDKIFVEACLWTDPVYPTTNGFKGATCALGEAVGVYGNLNLVPGLGSSFKGVITQTRYIVKRMYRYGMNDHIVYPDKVILISATPWVINFYSEGQ